MASITKKYFIRKITHHKYSIEDHQQIFYTIHPATLHFDFILFYYTDYHRKKIESRNQIQQNVMTDKRAAVPNLNLNFFK